LGTAAPAPDEGVGPLELRLDGLGGLDDALRPDAGGAVIT
jgi:hypothetical protein